MQDQIFEGETVDERLQRGAGRARAARQIDLSRTAPVIRAADIGEHVACPVLHDDDGEAAAVGEIVFLARHHALDCALQGGTDR